VSRSYLSNLCNYQYCFSHTMSMRPRKIVTEKKPSSEMFSTSDVVDFKSGVVFETATPDIKNSADAVTIRQCVADAMIKAAAESDSSKKYLSAPSVDDIERSVRSHVKKYLDMNISNQNANSEFQLSLVTTSRWRSERPCQSTCQGLPSLRLFLVELRRPFPLLAFFPVMLLRMLFVLHFSSTCR
jgi:hypothetical protein